MGSSKFRNWMLNSHKKFSFLIMFNGILTFVFYRMRGQNSDTFLIIFPIIECIYISD